MIEQRRYTHTHTNIVIDQLPLAPKRLKLIGGGPLLLSGISKY